MRSDYVQRYVGHGNSTTGFFFSFFLIFLHLTFNFFFPDIKEANFLGDNFIISGRFPLTSIPSFSPSPLPSPLPLLFFS